MERAKIVLTGQKHLLNLFFVKNLDKKNTHIFSVHGKVNNGVQITSKRAFLNEKNVTNIELIRKIE